MPAGSTDRQRMPRLRGVLWRALAWVAGGELPEANAATLATATREGRPSARTVLVKSASEQGFVFYTSHLSRKASELEANPRAALLFYWPWPPRQVRVEGAVEQVTAEESDAYWRSRPRGSQLAAAASHQSAPVDARATLLARVAELEREHRGGRLPRRPRGPRVLGEPGRPPPRARPVRAGRTRAGVADGDPPAVNPRGVTRRTSRTCRRTR